MSEASLMAPNLPPSELLRGMASVLKSHGYVRTEQNAHGHEIYRNDQGEEMYVDAHGWTALNGAGDEEDFGSDAKDLSKFFGKEWVSNISVDPDQMLNDEDKKWLKKMQIKSSLLKKGYGLTNEGQKDAVCPNCHQPIGEGEMVNYTQSGMEAHVNCPPATGQQPGQQAPGWQSRLNLPAGYKPPAQAQPAPAKRPGMISPNVGRPQASLIARINNIERKTSAFGETSHHHFSFEVPMKAGGTVAFHLAKAGLDNFEANNYREEGTTEFAFQTEPEMHIAEEIVRAEFAREIEGKHGGWGSWAPKMEDPSAVKPMNEVEQHLMSSEKTAEDPNSYLRGKQFSGPQAVPSRYEEALEQALAALDKLAEVGPSEDVRGCASMSAGDLRQFAEDAKAGKARHFSSDSDVPCCCVLGHLAFTKKK